MVWEDFFVLTKIFQNFGQNKTKIWLIFWPNWAKFDSIWRIQKLGNFKKGWFRAFTAQVLELFLPKMVKWSIFDIRPKIDHFCHFGKNGPKTWAVKSLNWGFFKNGYFWPPLGSGHFGQKSFKIGDFWSKNGHFRLSALLWGSWAKNWDFLGFWNYFLQYVDIGGEPSARRIEGTGRPAIHKSID